MGSFAERTVLPKGSGIAIPDAVDDAMALACGVAGAAAWLALEWTGGLQPGEDVLVLGAGGGVGQIAVQAARLLGARRVVAAARSASALQRAARLGADATVALNNGDLAAALAEALPDGADLVIDPLWGAPAATALGCLKPHGRLVQLGESAGADATIPSDPIRGRLLQIRGHTNFHTPPEIRRVAYERLLGHVAAGELTADVERVPLSDIANAWDRQRTSPGHKFVLIP
ncbi:zinc-binding dehydrogenase [Nocardia sp. R6R-6]|uniref:zinc-binding dehydrogenase n=1 Tax=Nocardia sp. R6R-6 TaxID=3459303 RepID=UPI00403DC1D7